MHTVGRHCCLWCEITSDKLKIPLTKRGYSNPRSLSTLRQDHERFIQGGGNVKTAKKFNNVIHKHMWDIPIDQV